MNPSLSSRPSVSSRRRAVSFLVLAVTGIAAPFACEKSPGSTAGPVPHPKKDAAVEASPDADAAASDAVDSPLSLGCKADSDCAGKPGGKYCDPSSGLCVACIPGDDKSCATGFVCNPKTIQCDVLCKAGELHCDGGEVMQCNPGPPAAWVPLSTAVVCDASKGQICNATTGTCEAVQPTGTAVPTGEYLLYAEFTPSNSVFKGGCGLDADGDTLYVNRDGKNLDVYTVKLEDTDGDGKLEPSQHPDNPKSQGPMEKRLLTFVKTYTETDNVPLGIPWDTELLALPDRIVTNGPKPNGSFTEYVFASKASTVIAAPTVPWTVDPLQLLGYGEKDKVWYAGDAYARRVYSFSAAKQRWVVEFSFPSLAGDHFDGLEVVVAPKTGVQYVYVSDMTSNFLGQYRRNDAGGWVQENLFKYKEGSGADVEGMGFGALNHFWIGNCGYGSAGVPKLYEIGGGDVDEYTTPVK